MMHNFENPSNELITALFAVQGIVKGIHDARTKSAYQQAILETIIERSTTEFLESSDTRSYIHHSIAVRLNAAEHFYAIGQTLDGDQQIVLAFASCCKLLGLTLACDSLEKMNQQIYRRIYAHKYA